MITVSIITPVYNGVNFIENCFDCIESQSYYSIEWVIVNDGSNDSSLDKILALESSIINIVVIDQLNFGAAEARKIGAQKSTGEYVVYLDIDDTISSDCIASAMKKFNQNID